MELYLTRIGKSLVAVSHAVPVGSRKVTVAFQFVSERTVYSRSRRGMSGIARAAMYARESWTMETERQGAGM
jgi:hypothetical protein